MPATPIRSHGTILKIATITVGGLKTASLSGTEVNFIETTAHDTVGGYKTFVGGLKDGGTLECAGNMDFDDLGQAEIFGAEGESKAFEITYVDGSKDAGTVVIGAASTTVDEDGLVAFSCSSKVSGPITRTPAP